MTRCQLNKASVKSAFVPPKRPDITHLAASVTLHQHIHPPVIPLQKRHNVKSFPLPSEESKRQPGQDMKLNASTK